MLDSVALTYHNMVRICSLVYPTPNLPWETSACGLPNPCNPRVLSHRDSTQRAFRNKAFGSLDATAYGPHCLSSFTTGFVRLKNSHRSLLADSGMQDDSTGYPTSEDCLTLNVIRPSGISAYNPIPVVVWSACSLPPSQGIILKVSFIVHGGFFVGPVPKRLQHFIDTCISDDRWKRVLSFSSSKTITDVCEQADLRYNATWLVQASVANGNPIMVVSIKCVACPCLHTEC